MSEKQRQSKVMASVKELEQLVNRINDLEKKAKSHDEKLEEKDSIIKELSEKLENQKKQIESLLPCKSKMIIPNVVNEDNLSLINTSFQWKFNIDTVRSGNLSLSPPFYNPEGNCFQLGSVFTENNFRVSFSHYRGQYDYATNEIELKEKFTLKVIVLGKNGNKKIQFIQNNVNYTIKTFSKRSTSYYFRINSNEIDNYAIDGYIHLNSIFI